MIIFDDYFWCWPKNANYYQGNSNIELYTEEQLQVPAVEMICKIFMDTDKEFIKVSDVKASRAVYKKIPVSQNNVLESVKQTYESMLDRKENELYIVNSRYQLLQKMIRADVHAKKFNNEIIIYGAGNIGKMYFDLFSDVVKVKAFVDKYSVETEYKGIPIIKLDELSTVDCDTIVVTACYEFKQIEEEIRARNVSMSIVSLDDCFNGEVR